MRPRVLVSCGDTTHQVDHILGIALQVMQVRWCRAQVSLVGRAYIAHSSPFLQEYTPRALWLILIDFNFNMDM